MSRCPLPALALLLPALVFIAPAGAAEPLTPTALQAKLKTPDALDLDDEILAMFGGEANVAKGPNPKVEGTTVAWAVEAKKGKPRVVSEDGKFTVDLTRISDTWLYAAAVTVPDGFATRWAFEVDGKTMPHPNANPRQGSKWASLEVYSEPAEGRAKPGVPKGKLAPREKFRSKIFDGTSRD